MHLIIAKIWYFVLSHNEALVNSFLQFYSKFSQHIVISNTLSNEDENFEIGRIKNTSEDMKAVTAEAGSDYFLELPRTPSSN